MKAIIDVFRMSEISPDKRIDVLLKLGDAINYEHAANVTEPLVYELVKILNPNHSILNDESFKRHAGVNTQNKG